MNLIMVTPRVDRISPLLAFIPTWVRHLAAKVERLWVVTPRAEALPMPKNVTIIEVGRDYDKGENLFHALANFHRIMSRLTRTEQVDGIFTHMYPKFALMSAPYAKRYDIPLVMWYTHKNISHQLRIASLFSDKIITASPETCRLNSPKVLAIGHGIDTDFFRPKHPFTALHEGCQTILTIGRISPIKNLDVMIEAVNLLVHQQGMSHLRFVCVGAPPTEAHQQYHAKIQALVKRYSLQNHMIFTGAVPHEKTLAFYQQSHLFINACNSGIDKAILEAMACQLPVILSNGAFKSMLAPNTDRLIFAPHDHADLAKKIATLLSLPREQQKEIGETMRQIIQSTHDVRLLMGKIRDVVRTISDPESLK